MFRAIIGYLFVMMLGCADNSIPANAEVPTETEQYLIDTTVSSWERVTTEHPELAIIQEPTYEYLDRMLVVKADWVQLRELCGKCPGSIFQTECKFLNGQPVQRADGCFTSRSICEERMWPEITHCTSYPVLVYYEELPDLEPQSYINVIQHETVHAIAHGVSVYENDHGRWGPNHDDHKNPLLWGVGGVFTL